MLRFFVNTINLYYNSISSVIILHTLINLSLNTNVWFKKYLL